MNENFTDRFMQLQKSFYHVQAFGLISCLVRTLKNVFM